MAASLLRDLFVKVDLPPPAVAYFLEESGYVSLEEMAAVLGLISVPIRPIGQGGGRAVQLVVGHCRAAQVCGSCRCLRRCMHGR